MPQPVPTPPPTVPDTGPTPTTPTPAPPPAAPSPATDQGFPSDTPLAEMTVEQREAYWKHKARKHEETVKSRADYDELKKIADQYRALEAESMTDHEKALTEAEQRGHAAALAAVGGQLVEAKLEALAAGRLNDTQRATLLENLDRSRFLKPDGTVDTDKLGALVEGIAPPAMGQPATGATATPAPHAPHLGQGARGGRATPSVADGEALYRQLIPGSGAAPQL